MAILTINEIIDIIIMSVLIGYIFSSSFAKFNVMRRRGVYAGYTSKPRITWHDFLFSIYVVVPGIVIHEFGHKFVAIAFGYMATFHSPISIQQILNPLTLITDPLALLMVIALILSYFGSTFVFFVPAYVSFSSMATPLQQSLIAFAGPLVNLVLWLASSWLIKTGKVQHKNMVFFGLTSRINMLLFIFNMLPIPGFDGFQGYYGLFRAIFG